MACETALPVRAARVNLTSSEPWDIDPGLDPKANDGELLLQVTRWYQRCLAGHHEAQEYLAQRDLWNQDLVNHFQLGYADRRLTRRLPPPGSPAGRRMRQRLQQVGICRPSGHGHFNGCLTIPLFDSRGQLIDIYGLRTARAFSPQTERHARLAGGDRAKRDQVTFHLHGLSDAEPVILTDGPFCAMALWRAGLTNVTCLLPEQEVDEALLENLRQLGAREVILVMANTQAGVALAETSSTRLTAAGLHTSRALLPAGEDAGSLLVARGAEELAAIVRRATGADTASHGVALGAQSKEQEPEQEPEQEKPEPAPQVVDVHPPPSSNGKDGSNVASSHATNLPSTDHQDSPTGDLEFTFDDRHYRVRGLAQNLSAERMKINLKVTRDGLFHVNILDLYSAAQRRAFIRDASEELYTAEDLVKRDLGRLLERLEREQETLVRSRLAVNSEPQITISEEDRRNALELLSDPRLTERILENYERCGLVGEENNKLTVYLACVSRLLPRPLALLVQSSSAAGKTSLVDATLRLMPEEHQVRYSAMTGQSLYYMGRDGLRNKILAVAEDEGVSEARYALKLLQSDGRLRIAAAGKDELTGRQRTQEYSVEGPVMMLLTTTSADPDRELQNRCLTLRVSETPEQTAAIHARQRAEYTLAGMQAAGERESICRLHHNAQRLLEPYRVVIPWAERLTFRSDQIQMRRDHDKYLTLIAASALLHQYQRKREVDGSGQPYLLATLDDIHLAGRLAAEAIGRSLDELLPQTRRLLVLLDDYVSQRARDERTRRTGIRFRQRELREALGWSDFMLRTHLARLVELEYVIAYRTGRGNEREYQLIYDGQGREGQRFVLGLVAPEQLGAPGERATEYDRQANYDSRIEVPDGGFERHSG